MNFCDILLRISFGDVIKEKFLEQIAENQLDLGRAAISVGISLVLGLLIYFIYKIAFRGVIYSDTFAMSLVLMTIITTAIIATISSNVVLSLGMVGALSIVRFRSAIKDPVDIMYLFWAISAGIIVGAQQYLFAAAVSVIIAAVCLLMKRVNGRNVLYLLIVRYSRDNANLIESLVRKTGAKVLNQTSSSEYIEISAELEKRNIPDNLIADLSSRPGIYNAVLCRYNGEYCE